jgi:hypothetical protein
MTPQLDDMALDRAAHLANALDGRAWDAGMAWYDQARQDILALARKYEVSADACFGGAAALSSLMPWERNLPALESILKAWAAGVRDAVDMPAVSRSHDPVRKTVAMLKGARPLDTIVKRGKAKSQAWKTLSFYLNLSGKSTRRATIDVWMWRILSGDMTSQHRPKGTQYMECESILRTLALDYGIRVHALQAALWVGVTGKAAS